MRSRIVASLLAVLICAVPGWPGVREHAGLPDRLEPLGILAGCADADSDGVCDDQDNCVGLPNPNQGSLIRLNEPLETNQYVQVLEISQDSSTVVFYVANGPGGLYSVPIDGGATSLLSGADIEGFEISQDSSTVVFTTGNGLHSVPIGGGTATQLNGPGSSILSFEINPDSSTVV